MTSWVWLWVVVVVVVVVCVQGSSGGGDVAQRAQLWRCSAGFCQHSSVSSPQLRENTLHRSVRPAALETELFREDSHHQSRRVRADLPMRGLSESNCCSEGCWRNTNITAWSVQTVFSCWIIFCSILAGHCTCSTQNSPLDGDLKTQCWSCLLLILLLNSIMATTMWPWSTKPVIRVNFLKLRFMHHLKAE